MPELIIRSGKLNGRKLVLPESEVVVGRDDDCQIRLTSADVSRRHCRILVTNSGLIVRDLGSRNGTFVNEEAVVDAMKLKEGDLLRVGPMIFEVPPLEEKKIPEESTRTPEVKSIEKTTPKKKKKKLFIALPARDEIGIGDSSEQDIASWLSAGDEDEEVSTGDTTIIPRSSPLLENIENYDDSPAVIPSGSAVPQKAAVSSFDTLADEAADVIRKHWEAVKQKESSE